MVNGKQVGPFFVTALKDSQGNPMVHTIGIWHGNGGHYLFHDYEDKDEAQERCDRLNEAVAEWVQGYLAPLRLGEEAASG